jgi:hypothetical protein
MIIVRDYEVFLTYGITGRCENYKVRSVIEVLHTVKDFYNLRNKKTGHRELHRTGRRRSPIPPMHRYNILLTIAAIDVKAMLCIDENKKPAGEIH